MPSVDRAPPSPRLPSTTTETVRATQTARLEGAFTADLVHDVLVKARADVGDPTTTVSMGAPKLLGSKVTQAEDGTIVVEDQVAVQVVMTTRRELTAMVDLLDRAHVENGQLTLAPVAHDVQEASP